MTAPELKPCPFCGGEAEIWRAHECRTAWIACMGKCVVLISKEYLSDDEAITAWNRRADLAAVRPAQARVKPTDAQINSACLSYRHDFGLMTKRNQDDLRFQANEWLIAWQKETRILPTLEPQPAPRDEVIAALMEALKRYKSRARRVPFDLAVSSDAALAAAKAVMK